VIEVDTQEVFGEECREALALAQEVYDAILDRLPTEARP
jgi:hypothetical protein